MTAVVRFKRLAHGEGLPLPAYATELAAGLDVCAAEDIYIPGHEHRVVKAGFEIEIPIGFEGQIRPRSGLAAKRGLTVLNAPGTIDADYRGEVLVILHATGSGVEVKRGDRIAQLVIAPVARAIIKEVTNLSATARGAGGLGSTGV